MPISVDKAENGFAIRLDGAVADVTTFEGRLDDILSAEEPDERVYDKINGLYKGEYMEGCDYSWAVASRRQSKRSISVRCVACTGFFASGAARRSRPRR